MDLPPRSGLPRCWGAVCLCPWVSWLPAGGLQRVTGQPGVGESGARQLSPRKHPQRQPRSLEACASPHTPRPSHEVPPPPASVAEQQDHWQGLSRLNFVLLDKGSSLMQSVFINNESSVSPCAPSLSLGDVGTHQTVSLVQATEGAGLMSLKLRAMAYLKQLIKMRFIHREPSPCGSKAS